MCIRLWQGLLVHFEEKLRWGANVVGSQAIGHLKLLQSQFQSVQNVRKKP